MTKPLARKMWVAENALEDDEMNIFTNASDCIDLNPDPAAALIYVFAPEPFEKAAMLIFDKAVNSRMSFKEAWPELKKELLGEK